jgi:putative DNA primase/helicase
MLPEKLRAEYPGILNWMLRGCLIWQTEDLPTPASVEGASAAYLDAEDMLGQWLQDRAERIPGARTPRSAMYRD